jgi:hypothetical protein
VASPTRVSRWSAFALASMSASRTPAATQNASSSEIAARSSSTSASFSRTGVRTPAAAP